MWESSIIHTDEFPHYRRSVPMESLAGAFVAEAGLSPCNSERFNLSIQIQTRSHHQSGPCVWRGKKSTRFKTCFVYLICYISCISHLLSLSILSETGTIRFGQCIFIPSISNLISEHNLSRTRKVSQEVVAAIYQGNTAGTKDRLFK